MTTPPEDRTTLEKRGPSPWMARASLGAAGISLLSALWAYLEYAGEKREPLFALALAGVFFGTGLSILLTFRGAFTFRTERGPRERQPEATAPPPVLTTLGLEKPKPRRRFFGVLGSAATGLLGIFLLPLRSLGTNPSAALRRTAWRRGARLLTVDGRPLRAADLPPGTSCPFVPEGAADDANSFGLLIRLQGTPAKGDSLGGLRAFSSICTHAGCAVSIFLDESSVVVCPCHWSTFSAEDGQIVSGPASAPLPRLPLAIDADGHLMADGDFSRPIGPRLGCAGCLHAARG